jgi:tight adherence protein C
VSTVLAPILFGGAAAVIAAEMPTVAARLRLRGVSARRRRTLEDAVGAVAGTPEGLRRVARHQMIGVVAASVVGLVVVASAPSTTNFLAACLMAAGGWQFPLITARGREKNRRARFELDLSDALGEMVMGVEAGLTLESVMRLYAERHDSSLADELETVLDRIGVGYPRVQAMEEFASRTPTDGVRMFVSAVQQNQTLGVPLAEVLRQQGETARRRRRQAVEEHAAKLSLKMIFPTVFCILPVLLIVICGPAVVRLIEALSR